MICAIIGAIVGDIKEDAPFLGALVGGAVDLLILAGGITFACVHTQKCEEAKNRMHLRSEEINKVIQDKIGEDFSLLTIDALKGDNGQKQLKLFGESKKAIDGKMECSTMTNYTISVSDEQYRDYMQALKNIVENNKLENDSYKGDVNFLGDYRDCALDYEKDITSVFDAIDDCVNNSKDYTVTTCGPTSNMMNVLKREYNFTTPDTLTKVSGNGYYTKSIRTNFIDNGLTLLNVSDVEKNNGNNYVYVNTLQPDSAGKTWSLCTGRFTVDGKDLTQEQVFDKIYSGDYSFVNGDKQTHASTENVENNDAVLSF